MLPHAEDLKVLSISLIKEYDEKVIESLKVLQREHQEPYAFTPEERYHYDLNPYRSFRERYNKLARLGLQVYMTELRFISRPEIRGKAMFSPRFWSQTEQSSLRNSCMCVETLMESRNKNFAEQAAKYMNNLEDLLKKASEKMLEAARSAEGGAAPYEKEMYGWMNELQNEIHKVACYGSEFGPRKDRGQKVGPSERWIRPTFP